MSACVLYSVYLVLAWPLTLTTALCRLYEKLDRAHLLAFLETSRQYRLRDARDLLARAQPPLLRELAHVTHRMGDSSEAIRILVLQAQDVRAALVLAAQLDDASTWDLLVRTTVETRSGDLIGALLDGISTVQLGGTSSSTYANILRSVPDCVHIPRLQARLLVLLRDRRLHAVLVAGCGDMCSRDMHTLVVRKSEVQRAGLRAEAAAACQHCQAPLKDRARGGVDGHDDAATAVFFFCRHAFHQSCALEAAAAQAAALRAETVAAASRPRSRSRSSSVSSFYGASSNSLRGDVNRSGRRRGSVAQAGAFDELPGAAQGPGGGDDADETDLVDTAPRSMLRCPVCTSSSDPVYRDM